MAFNQVTNLPPTKDKGAGTGGENINAEAIVAVGNRHIDIKLRTLEAHSSRFRSRILESMDFEVLASTYQT